MSQGMEGPISKPNKKLQLLEAAQKQNAQSRPSSLQ